MKIYNNVVTYMNNQVIYHYEEKRVTIWLVFMVILSNNIMQNSQNNYPQKGLMVITPDAVVTENG